MSARKSASRRVHLKPSESRRGFLRVDFESGSKVGVATPSGHTSYDALDLSVYGLSFLARPEDGAHFTMGMELPSLAFLLEGRQINVKGKVAYLHTGLVAGLSKVAVEFTHVPVDDVWFISRYVAEKSGVSKPRQIGSGHIDLGDLDPFSPARGSASRKKKSAKSKPKAKARSKAKTKPKTKAKAKTKPRAKAKSKPARGRKR
jgi:hypothetical protein